MKKLQTLQFLFAEKNFIVSKLVVMFQVTFSEQSLSILNDLPKSDQLKLMDTLSSESNNG